MAKAAKAAANKKPVSKSQVIAAIAEETELSRKDVSRVMESLGGQIKKALSGKGPGVINVGGLMKIKVRSVPAKPARTGKDPFTGEMRQFAAKPASKKVKVLPLKALKEMV
jgi:nucleoid DNA-binding protein